MARRTAAHRGCGGAPAPGAARWLLALALAGLPARPAPAQSEADPRARAVEAFQRGELERAETLGRVWLERHPDDPAVTHLLGMVQVSAGRRMEAEGLARSEVLAAYGRAEQTLLRAERLAGASPLPGLDYALGHILLAQQRYEDACDRLTRALAASPGQPALLGRRGQCRIELGRFEAAAADLARAVELAPRSFNNRILYGTALFRLGRLDDARETLWDYHQLTEGDPEATDRWQVLRDLYRYSGNDLHAARRALEEARRVAPGWLLGRAWLGSVYYRLGEPGPAEAELRAVLESPRASEQAQREALRYSGLLARQRGELEEAGRLFARALALAPRDAALLQQHAAVLRQLGDARAEQAQARFEATVELQNEVRRLRDRVFSSPRLGEHRVALIRALVELGEREEAARELEQLRRLAPSHPAIPALARRVRDEA